VLQVDYASTDLPGGLEWAGVEADTAEERAQKWAEQNAEAIKAHREHIEKLGIWSDGLRTW
jgi:post-segregation antitoxin (ccd killing protein)